MNKKVYISLITALAISANAADLGTISVESSTIDDKFESKKTEVSNTTIITAEDVTKINPTNVENILNTIPGITASNVGNDRVKIHIRGIDNQMYMGEKPGVAVVIDGVPVQETSGKINLDLDNIASIKVIKGSASYLYGNDAIAGAIVITTKRPQAISSSKLETEVGSFGFKRFLAATNQSLENGALQLQGTSRDTDGYWDDSYLKHKSLNGKYQHYISDTSDITFGVDYTKRETGDGTSISGENNAATNPTSIGEVSYSAYYDTNLIKTFTTYSKDFIDNSNVMVSLYKFIDETEYYTSRDSTTKAYHKAFKDEKWVQNGIKSEYRKPYKDFAFLTGIDIQRNDTNNKEYNTDITKIVGTQTDESRTDEDINALYFELKNQLSENLTSTINYRYDQLKYDYRNDFDPTLNVQPSYNTSSYRLGFNYQLSDTDHLYTSVSTGFRAPTAEQISSNQDLKTSNPTKDIPTTLDPEQTINYELGMRGSIADFKYDTSIYQLDRKNYLGRRAGSYYSRTNSVDDNEDIAYDNLGDMRSRGLEVSLKSDSSKMVSFTTAYTFLEAKFKEYSIDPKDGGLPAISLNGNTVPRTSKHTLNLTVDVKPIDKLNISTELIAKSSYYADEANLYKQSGYEVVNLRSEYKINKSIELFAKIENLLDKDYYQFVTVSYGSDMSGATIRVAPSRAYYAGLRYKF